MSLRRLANIGETIPSNTLIHRSIKPALDKAWAASARALPTSQAIHKKKRRIATAEHNLCLVFSIVLWLVVLLQIVASIQEYRAMARLSEELVDAECVIVRAGMFVRDTSPCKEIVTMGDVSGHALTLQDKLLLRVNTTVLYRIKDGTALTRWRAAAPTMTVKRPRLGVGSSCSTRVSQCPKAAKPTSHLVYGNYQCEACTAATDEVCFQQVLDRSLASVEITYDLAGVLPTPAVVPTVDATVFVDITTRRRRLLASSNTALLTFDASAEETLAGALESLLKAGLGDRYSEFLAIKNLALVAGTNSTPTSTRVTVIFAAATMPSAEALATALSSTGLASPTNIRAFVAAAIAAAGGGGGGRRRLTTAAAFQQAVAHNLSLAVEPTVVMMPSAMCSKPATQEGRVTTCTGAERVSEQCMVTCQEGWTDGTTTLDTAGLFIYHAPQLIARSDGRARREGLATCEKSDAVAGVAQFNEADLPTCGKALCAFTTGAGLITTCDCSDLAETATAREKYVCEESRAKLGGSCTMQCASGYTPYCIASCEGMLGLSIDKTIQVGVSAHTEPTPAPGAVVGASDVFGCSRAFTCTNTSTRTCVVARNASAFATTPQAEFDLPQLFCRAATCAVPVNATIQQTLVHNCAGLETSQSCVATCQPGYVVSTGRAGLQVCQGVSIGQSVLGPGTWPTCIPQSCPLPSGALFPGLVAPSGGGGQAQAQCVETMLPEVASCGWQCEAGYDMVGCSVDVPGLGVYSVTPTNVSLSTVWNSTSPPLLTGMVDILRPLRYGDIIAAGTALRVLVPSTAAGTVLYHRDVACVEALEQQPHSARQAGVRLADCGFLPGHEAVLAPDNIWPSTGGGTTTGYAVRPRIDALGNSIEGTEFNLTCAINTTATYPMEARCRGLDYSSDAVAAAAANAAVGALGVDQASFLLVPRCKWRPCVLPPHAVDAVAQARVTTNCVEGGDVSLTKAAKCFATCTSGNQATCGAESARQVNITCASISAQHAASGALNAFAAFPNCTQLPTATPTLAPTINISNASSLAPSKVPTQTGATFAPSTVPTKQPTKQPSVAPSKMPSKTPTTPGATFSPTTSPTSAVLPATCATDAAMTAGVAAATAGPPNHLTGTAVLTFVARELWNFDSGGVGRGGEGGVKMRAALVTVIAEAATVTSRTLAPALLPAAVGPSVILSTDFNFSTTQPPASAEDTMVLPFEIRLDSPLKAKYTAQIVADINTASSTAQRAAALTTGIKAELNKAPYPIDVGIVSANSEDLALFGQASQMSLTLSVLDPLTAAPSKSPTASPSKSPTTSPTTAGRRRLAAAASAGRSQAQTTQQTSAVRSASAAYVAFASRVPAHEDGEEGEGEVLRVRTNDAPMPMPMAMPMAMAVLGPVPKQKQEQEQEQEPAPTLYRQRQRQRRRLTTTTTNATTATTYATDTKVQPRSPADVVESLKNFATSAAYATFKAAEPDATIELPGAEMKYAATASGQELLFVLRLAVPSFGTGAKARYCSSNGLETLLAAAEAVILDCTALRYQIKVKSVVNIQMSPTKLTLIDSTPSVCLASVNVSASNPSVALSDVTVTLSGLVPLKLSTAQRMPCQVMPAFPHIVRLAGPPDYTIMALARDISLASVGLALLTCLVCGLLSKHPPLPANAGEKYFVLLKREHDMRVLRSKERAKQKLEALRRTKTKKIEETMNSLVHDANARRNSQIGDDNSIDGVGGHASKKHEAFMLKMAALRTQSLKRGVRGSRTTSSGS